MRFCSDCESQARCDVWCFDEDSSEDDMMAEDLIECCIDTLTSDENIDRTSLISDLRMALRKIEECRKCRSCEMECLKE